jgi:glycosyltransferase involved in cell wall biosynthesis
MFRKIRKIACDHGMRALLARGARRVAHACTGVFQKREGRAANFHALRACAKPTALIVDEHVPFFDRDAGSARILHLVEAFSARGWRVIFGSLDRREYQPYTRLLRDAGVVVLAGFDADAVRAAAQGVRWDIVWLSRPSVAELLIGAVREAAPSVCLAYDTVDLHYRRLRREEEVTGRPTAWRMMRERELGLARRADLTIVTDAGEGEELSRAEIARVEQFAVFAAPARDVPGWNARSGFLFVGNYAHAPNVDAARVLVEDVLPLMRRRLGAVALTLAGADPTTPVRRLAGSGVDVPGYVADLGASLARRRVFLAPLRFGAGVKGKIVQALANGLPVVTTTIGAEGIPDSTAWGIVTDDNAAFAEAAIRLHEDRALWERLSAGATRTAERFGEGILRATSGGRGDARGTLISVENAASANAAGEIVIGAQHVADATKL